MVAYSKDMLISLLFLDKYIKYVYSFSELDQMEHVAKNIKMFC